MGGKGMQREKEEEARKHLGSASCAPFFTFILRRAPICEQRVGPAAHYLSGPANQTKHGLHVKKINIRASAL
jgi:hypothetical protein